MGESTAISWTDHTFNPWIGCSRVSAGCQHCYAETRSKRLQDVQWGDSGTRKVTSDAYWRAPLKWDRQARDEGRAAFVFCASLADVFEDRPELVEPRARLAALIYDTPHLVWQLLTKRPENVNRLFDQACGRVAGDRPFNLPGNVWIGTTVENQAAADERVPILLDIPAAARFLSCEPLLGPVVLRPEWLTAQARVCGPAPKSEESARAIAAVIRATAQQMGARFVDWVIVGGESGPGCRPMQHEWAVDLVESCRKATVPVWFKQNGGLLRINGVPGGDRIVLDGWRQELVHERPPVLR